MNQKSDNKSDNKSEKYKYILDELREYMFMDEIENNIIKENEVKEFKLIQPIQKINKLINKEFNKISNEFKSSNEFKKQDTERKKPDFFLPREKDSLFWCFYIMKHGYSNYDISPKHIVEEKRIKIEYVEKIRENKALFKKHKFASISHVENHLVNEHKIDIYTFFSLCLLENMNVLYIHKKSFYDLVMNEEELHNMFVIQLFDNTNHGLKYGLKDINTNEVIEQVEQFKKSLFKMETIGKPIKSVSSYKVSELQDFCTRLGLETHKETKKKTKNELYESIVQYF